MDHAVKHFALVGYRRAATHATFGRGGVAEKMRCLHQEQFLVLQKVADRFLQDVGGGHVVAIKKQDKVAVGVT